KTLGGIEVEWTYAKHGPETSCCGFLLRYQGKSILYTGDTSTTERIKDLKDVDLLLLPIPEQYMGGQRGAEFADAVAAGFVLPCHYNTYDIPGEKGNAGWLGGDPEAVRRHMKRPERLIKLLQGQALHIEDGKATVVRPPNPRQLREQAWWASRPVKIDGDLADWQQARWTIRLRPRVDTPWATDTARAAALWDREFLYLAVDVRDEDVRADESGHDPPVWKDDCVEVDVDPQCEQTTLFAATDRIYHVTPRNAVHDASGSATGDKVEKWDSKFGHAVKVHGTLNDSKDTDRGYVVEMAIPWSELGVTPEPGRKIAIDFAVLDRDEGKRGYYYDWANLVHVQVPVNWGVIELVPRWRLVRASR
ncbi:MAG TPA: sugar-binding protein, partial [Phycisphaerae bacterium]|nr:sugar-binding protein [Phycisphaerae bacterium]